LAIDNANKKAWNGNYYSGYIFSNGNPVDTVFKKNALNKKNPTSDDFMMMLMPQTWSLVSGGADKINASEKVIDSVFKYLFDKEVGALKLNYPAYTKFDKTIGRITGFAPEQKKTTLFFHMQTYFFLGFDKKRNA
jgi:cellobiose phosphorylase